MASHFPSTGPTQTVIQVAPTPCLGSDSPVGSDPDWRSFVQFSIIPLQIWYNDDGLWDTTGWWNSANCLSTLLNYALIDSDARAGVSLIAERTFVRAPLSSIAPFKDIVNGTTTTVHDHGGIRYSGSFLNDYYDDEGWWAMAWIYAFDLTGEEHYLQTAADLFDDMVQGYTAPCGGIWWDKGHRAQVAIANELFIQVAASLANRSGHLNGSLTYLDWAMRAWTWFESSGMINSSYNINDGLDPQTCKNNHGVVWSYNQGVILGALAELSNANLSVLPLAAKIAHAAISALSDDDGILHDICEPACGADGTHFKGIFLRGLSALHAIAPDPRFRDFILTNARSIQEKNKNIEWQFSVIWSGPFVHPANASTHCAAMDALVAAARLS